jgi:hypothetical protein
MRSSVVFSSVAVAATGIAVGSGLASGTSADPGSATVAAVATDISSVIPEGTEAVAAGAPATADERAEQGARGSRVSRSDRRAASDPLKEAELEAPPTEGNAITRTEDATDDDPRDIARALLPDFGFGPEQFSCLDQLYVSESNWRIDADNPTSSAYGIPQALPGSKMASAGADWATNPVTQIRWGLGYIEDRYGTPCNAWSFKQGNNWY